MLLSIKFLYKLMLYLKRFDKYFVYEYIFEQLSIFSKENKVIDIFFSLVKQRFLKQIIYYFGNNIFFNKNLKILCYR